MLAPRTRQNLASHNTKIPCRSYTCASVLFLCHFTSLPLLLSPLLTPPTTTPGYLPASLLSIFSSPTLLLTLSWNTMNSRDHPDMPPASSYPSPNATQMGQGTMQYYTNRQLTADELLSAELSRETGGANLTDSSTNGVHHGQSMVLGSSNPGAHDMGRPPSPDHHQQHMLQFPPSQQVGVDPNHDLSYGDQSARRKRSKISRACDECRRKKVTSHLPG